MRKKSPSLYFSSGICALSVLDLDGTQAGILFVLNAGILWLHCKKEREILPPIAFIIVAYLAAFPLSMLFPELYPDLWNSIPTEALDYGMLWALRGFNALVIGYITVNQFSKHRQRNREFNFVLDNMMLSYTVYILTCIGWFAIMAWIVSSWYFGIGLTFIEGAKFEADSGEGTLRQIFNFLSDLRYPFFFVYLILRFWNKTDMQLFLLFILLIFVSVIEIIVIGSKASIIGLVIVALLAQSVLGIKYGAKMIATGVIAIGAIFLSFGTITEYRAIMQARYWSGENAFDFSVQFDSFKKAFLRNINFSEESAARETEVDKKDIYSRFGAGMFSFSNLLEHTGREPPYENALESFLIPIYAVAPRFLVADKPEFFSSGANAKQYYGWTYGGIAVSLPGSFYYAWGYVGVILGMAFLGGLFAYVVEKVWRRGGASPHWLIFLPFLVMNMIYVDVTFQVITTNLIRIAVMLWLLHLLFPLARGTMRRRVARLSSPDQRRRHV